MYFFFFFGAAKAVSLCQSLIWYCWSVCWSCV